MIRGPKYWGHYLVSTIYNSNALRCGLTTPYILLSLP